MLCYGFPINGPACSADVSCNTFFFVKFYKFAKLMLFTQNNKLIGLHFMVCIFLFLIPRSISLFEKI
jgi:hypothetical protein